MNKEVASIIVLYNPNSNLLEKVIDMATSQCGKIFLIDNSELDNSELYLKVKRISYHPFCMNFGIAYAQNEGIKLLKKEGFKYVIFLDQDSIPSLKMVDTLVAEYEYLIENNQRVATIGPIPINSQTGQRYEPRFVKEKMVYISGINFLSPKQIISSGGMMEVKVFEDIGKFEEELFIDLVDHEWCWRARSLGYTIFLSPRTQLIHRLGEGDKGFFGLKTAITSSFRLYYQYRNFVLLLFRAHVPVYWKLNNFIKYSIKLVYYPMFYKDIKVFESMIFGIRDGIKILIKGYDK